MAGAESAPKFDHVASVMLSPRSSPVEPQPRSTIDDLLDVVDDGEWIKIEGLIVHDGNDPRDHSSGIVGGVSSNGRHNQHCQHGATNRFRPPQPSRLSDPRPGTAWWLWNRNRVMRGRPVWPAQCWIGGCPAGVTAAGTRHFRSGLAGDAFIFPRFPSWHGVTAPPASHCTADTSPGSAAGFARYSCSFSP